MVIYVNRSGLPMKKVYMNIGNEKSYLFLPASLRLINVGIRRPFLFAAMGEATLCAKQGYYAAGILAFSQVLNELGVQSTEERHEVAHELLSIRPNKAGYDKLRKLLEETAQSQQDKEARKTSDPDAYADALTKKLKDAQSQIEQSLQADASPSAP